MGIRKILLLLMVGGSIYLYVRWNMYLGLKDGKCTVGEVIRNTADGRNGRGFIYYRYNVNGEWHEKGQSSVLFGPEPNTGNFVVLYDQSRPYSSILWLDYPVRDELGTDLTNFVDKSRIRISFWTPDLVIAE